MTSSENGNISDYELIANTGTSLIPKTSTSNVFHGQKVAVILPVFKDDYNKWYEFFVKRMIPSLNHLAGLPIIFLIGFQRFDDGEIDWLLKSMKQYLSDEFDFRFFSRCFPTPPSMFLIREEIAKLYNDSDFYIFWDDDMKFSPNVAIRYRQIIEFLIQNPRCGSVMATPHSKKILPPGIERRDNIMWSTYSGLFLRNLKDQKWRVVNGDSLKCKGGLEDTYAIYSRMDLGYWAAKAYNVPVIHHATRIDDRFEETAEWKGRYPKEDDMHNPKNLDIIKLIMSKWDENWFYKSGRIPRGIPNIK